MSHQGGQGHKRGGRSGKIYKGEREGTGSRRSRGRGKGKGRGRGKETEKGKAASKSSLGSSGGARDGGKRSVSESGECRSTAPVTGSYSRCM